MTPIVPNLSIAAGQIRYDWTLDQVMELYQLPFNDLLFLAASIHRQNFNPNEVQVSTLLSIKTGSCPEDCKYCPQSAHYSTGLEKEKLIEIDQVIAQAKAALDSGASRFCMGAAWRSPTERDMPQVVEMVRQVKSMGLETCMTLGMLDQKQAQTLSDAGLDYYNHNLDTSPEFYGQIISTRTFGDRLATLQHVRDSGMKVCSGGILGMGEQQADRASMLIELARMEPQPESVPVNMLVRVPGTPMESAEDVDPFDFIRTVAVARIMMPASHVRLSAGRESMNDQMQSMAFFAGANSIFYGEKLLTTANPEANRDKELFRRLGIQPEGKATEVHVGSWTPENCPKNNNRFYDATMGKKEKSVN